MKILLANPRGFCAGVDRAIEIVERAEKFGGKVTLALKFPRCNGRQHRCRGTASSFMARNAVEALKS